MMEKREKTSEWFGVVFTWDGKEARFEEWCEV